MKGLVPDKLVDPILDWSSGDDEITAQLFKELVGGVLIIVMNLIALPIFLLFVSLLLIFFIVTCPWWFYMLATDRCDTAFGKLCDKLHL